CQPVACQRSGSRAADDVSEEARAGRCNDPRLRPQKPLLNGSTRVGTCFGQWLIKCLLHLLWCWTAAHHPVGETSHVGRGQIVRSLEHFDRDGEWTMRTGRHRLAPPVEMRQAGKVLAYYRSGRTTIDRTFEV